VHVLLTDDAGIFHGKGKTQHDQIGISSIQAVRIIRQEGMLVGPNELHDFMFSLSRRIRTSKNNGESLPMLILLDLLEQEEVDHFVKLLHEARAW
jgi:hypothetical protein